MPNKNVCAHHSSIHSSCHPIMLARLLVVSACGSPHDAPRTRPTLELQFTATERVSESDSGGAGGAGDGCVMARKLPNPVVSRVWFDAENKRIAQINAELARDPLKPLTTVDLFDRDPPMTRLLEPFFNSTVCYEKPIGPVMCPNGTMGCKATYGHWGELCPFTSVFGMWYPNTTYLRTDSTTGDELWRYTAITRTPLPTPHGTQVFNITRNYTYYVGKASAAAEAAAATSGSPPPRRPLRRYEWTQSLPKASHPGSRFCAVFDYTKDYVAGQPDLANFGPPKGTKCVNPAAASDPPPQPAPTQPTLTWVDARPLLHGTGFPAAAKAHFYDRLPAGAQHTTRGAVWSLSRDTAGMFIQFASNASSLSVNATYIYETVAMWHFPSTGVAGFDLYAFDEGNKTWRWTSTTDPSQMKAGEPWVQALHPVRRGATLVRYRLHLPLYNGVSAVSLGFGGNCAVLLPDAISKKKPVVWYGTSIAQGGVASRPGMAFTNIISRHLDREVLNFGFSGNCLMEPGVAQWLATIDAALFVIDCSWNMGADMIGNRTVPLVELLRRAKPSTPVVLAENTEDGRAWAIPSANATQTARRTNLATAYAALTQSPTSPDKNLHYVSGHELYSFSPTVGGLERAVINPTVGGTHPTDLGMISIAAYYIKFLPPLLASSTNDEVASISSLQANEQRAWRAPIASPLSTEARASAEEAAMHEEALAFIRADGGERSMPGEAQSAAPPPAPAAATATSAKTTWLDIGGPDGLTLMGRAFDDTLPGEYFDRLPAAAKSAVRDAVWQLSRDSTGMYVAFRSKNASAIMINYTLDTAAAPLWHMPASGTSGADCFRYDEGTKSYRFIGALHAFPASPGKPFNASLASGIDPVGSDRYLIFLPLRKHVVAASVGVLGTGDIEQDRAYGDDGITVNGRKPIIWYGTSIDQGGVASRPGATYTNILTRSLGRAVLNFGFAGNGMDEISVMEWLVKLPAALIVIDCLPNLTPEEVSNRTVPLVNFLRAHGHATTPVVLAAGTTYGNHWFAPALNDEKRAALLVEYRKLVAAGDANLHLVANHDDALFAYDELVNPTVGGTHPSDLGHREIAAFYEKYLPELIAD